MLIPSQKEIDTEFAILEKNHNTHVKGRKKATGMETVLQYMLDWATDKKIWYWAWELNNKHNSLGGYLSHKGCARASDLAIHHPDLVEDRRIGRFKVYRIRLENLEKIKEFLNK